MDQPWLLCLKGFRQVYPIDPDIINAELSRRQKGTGAGPLMKIERDHAQILSGIMENLTIGAPLALLIENYDHVKWKGKPIKAFTTPRPGHADLAEP